MAGEPTRARSLMPPIVAGLALAFVIASLAAQLLGVNLGARLPPFFAKVQPHIDPLAAAGLPLLAAAAGAAVAFLRRIESPWAFGLLMLGFALVTRLALAAAGNGVSGWDMIFDERGHNEYLPALPAVEALGLPGFLDRFAQISTSLPIHPSAHPPGLLALLYLTGIGTPEAMAALTILAGALAVPLTYALGRGPLEMRDGEARVAAVLVGLSPGMLIYGATSADALFATLGLLAAIPLCSRTMRAWLAGAAAAALGSFFAYSLLAVPAFATVLAAFRGGIQGALRLGAICGVVLVAFYGGLYAATGFDLLGALTAADEAYRVGISSIRPYIYWLFGSPIAFLVAAGLPTAWYWLRSLAAGQQLAIALAVIVAIAALMGFTKAETERIWLFLVPFAALGAARVLPEKALAPAVAILVAQAVAVELLLYTAW